ncbi:hypothetical protein [Engelhardtia mirabilis]|uniref:Uncharacterized protein n=1 Tax=Engelhardtia mirabilis TaxID=2528011 RepID=A0A518BQA9_9BACT|nr:hypothetical protein Pla133_42560 [Planctomycetes bacterium Pla133]QDV03467.1 hypothetical protein Pla86_42550 [Planctomycetes bacterium Pla86]
MNDTLETVAIPAKHPVRRVLGVLVRGPIGCISFLLGATVVLVALVPVIGSRIGPQAAEDAFGESFMGRLEIDGVDLSWVSRQAVTGIVLEDPDGERVLDASISLPALTALARGSGGKLGRIAVELPTVELTRNTEGNWNVARALTPRGSDKGTGGTGKPRAGGPGPLAGLADMNAEFVLAIGRMAIADLGEGGPRTPLELAEFSASIRLEPGKPGTIEGSGAIRSPELGRVELRGELADGRDLSSRLPLPIRSLSLSVDRLSVQWIDDFLRQGGRLVELVGPVAAVEAVLSGADGDASARSLRLHLGGSRTTATLHLRFEAGQLVLDRDQPSTVQVLDPSGLAAGYVSASLPEHLSLITDSQSIEMSIDRLVLPLPASLGVASEPVGLAVEVNVDLGSWLLQTPSSTLALDRMRLGAALTSEAGLRASMTASTGGDGAVSIDLETAPLGELLKDLELSRAPNLQLEIAMAGVPTDPVDAALGADGLLLDLLGSELSMDAALRPTDRRGVWSADLTAHSPVAQLRMEGEVEGARLLGREGRPLELSFDLTPLSSPRIVGTLLPMLASAEKPPGADPARLSLSGYSLPLDGDLSGLMGELELDVGEITARWLPKLGGSLDRLVEPLDLDPFVVQIADGRVTHPPFQIAFHGQQVTFEGAVELATGEAQFDALIPSTLVGGEVGDLLARAGGTLGRDVTVPLSLRGRWPAVKVAFDTADLQRDLLESLGGELGIQAADALEDVIREAVGDAVGERASDGLRSLLKAFGRDG